MVCLFINKDKFKEFDCDHTLTWLNALKSYLRKLKNNGEKTDTKFKVIRLNNARLAEASGLPKIDKELDHLQPFRPIIGTNDTALYLITTFLAKLLKPLTTKEFFFFFDDSLDVARKINNIPK